jgi:hypothetical protein
VLYVRGADGENATVRVTAVHNCGRAVSCHRDVCYKFQMVKRTGWVVYERRDGEFIFLTKSFKTRKRAEQERAKLIAHPVYERAAIGVGFVRMP